MPLLHLHIQLEGIAKPPVWRRVTVPAHFTALQLHAVIQATFGWEDYHLWEFTEWASRPMEIVRMPYDDEDEEEFILDDDFPLKVYRASEKRVDELLPAEGARYRYTYDLGDNWQHAIKVEKITADDVPTTADCTAGKGATPPEDCGGPPGYETLKKVLADSAHPQHAELREWLGLEEGGVWDADVFDLAQTQAVVRAVI